MRYLGKPVATRPSGKVGKKCATVSSGVLVSDQEEQLPDVASQMLKEAQPKPTDASTTPTSPLKILKGTRGRGATLVSMRTKTAANTSLKMSIMKMYYVLQPYAMTQFHAILM
jgi:hypothetical protein